MAQLIVDRYNKLFDVRWSWSVRIISLLVLCAAICSSVGVFYLNINYIYFFSLFFGFILFVDTFVRSIEWFFIQDNYVKDEVIRPSDSNVKNIISVVLGFPLSLVVFYAVEDIKPYVILTFYGFGFLAANIVNVSRYRKERNASKSS